MFLLRIDPNAASTAMTEDELRTIVDVSHEDGVIESDEKEMIYNVFDLGDANAKDIMVPRVHVTFAEVNNTYEELIAIFREDKFTRLPVYEDTPDNIVGIINMKDLLLYNKKTETFNIRDIMREPHFTYEYKDISELLVEMRDSTFNIAIVLDEYGEMAGLITLEDILEEIVGEIHDEYDEKEDDMFRQISEQEYIIEGSMNLDDINDRLETDLVSEDYDSLGGFIIEHLDRLPEVGDEVCTDNGIRLIVEALDKNRVESVRMYLPEKHDADNKSELSSSESGRTDSFHRGKIIHLIPISNINEHIKIPYLDLTDLERFLLCLSFKSYYISDNQSLAQHQSSFFLTAAITAPAANASPAIGTIGDPAVSPVCTALSSSFGSS